MEFAEVRTQLRDKLIGLGYQEWTDASIDVDVPDTIIENSFRVTVTGGTGRPLNMHVLFVEHDVKLSLWKKGFLSEVEAQDKALESVEEILCSVLEPAFRTLTRFKKIDFDGYTITPISEDNSHVAKIEMNFKIQTGLGVTNDVS